MMDSDMIIRVIAFLLGVVVTLRVVKSTARCWHCGRRAFSDEKE